MDFLCCLGWNPCCLATTEYGEWRFVEGISYDVMSFDSRIAEGLQESLPQLQTLVLVNNSIEELVRCAYMYMYVCSTMLHFHACIQSDLDPLASLHNLTYLRYIFLFRNWLSKLSSCVFYSLLRNPVVHKPSYRYYVIHKIPQLRVLDFKRIKLKVGDSNS